MRSVLLVLLAAALFGTTGTAQALGAPDADPVSVGAARLLLGGTALALVAVLSSRRRPPHTAPGSASGVGHTTVVVVGALAVVAYQPTFFAGVDRNGVAVGTLIALGTAPLATGALSWATTRAFPGVRWSVATLLSVAGLVWLTGAGPGTREGVDAVGLAASLSAGLSYAVYAVCSKRLLDDGWSPSKTMGTLFGAGALGTIPLVLFSDTTWIVTASGLTTVLWLGLATVLVAYLLFASGLRGLTAPVVATLTLAEPLVASALGIIVLGESPSLRVWIGVGVIVAGMIVLVGGSSPSSRSRRGQGPGANEAINTY
ncbi:DMT family transporter [Marisediminicola sp. LYQ134]|uniref:DMT family transporter n=1 Tax=Marisediminicola sp. LYQ134 TaxID=3391061 RepID=UPI003983ACAA